MSVAEIDISSLVGVTNKKLLIDGKWVEPASGEHFESRNPATGVHLANIASGTKEDIDRAVAAARRAFDDSAWSRMRPAERQKILLRLADLIEANVEQLCHLDTIDMGVPITASRTRKDRVVRLIRYYASLAVTLGGETIDNSLPSDVFTYTLREPVGVVGAITPWNAPLTSTFWKIGPVLATGCTMVLKPAEQASLTALRIGELVLEAGVPEGVVNIVTGYGSTAGAALAEHGDVDKVAFTGSHITGRKIIEASKGNIKRVSLELGGKSPNIIFADADLDAAVPSAAMACFFNTGQICSAGTRLLVQRPVYDDFMARVADYAKTLTIGDGLDPNTQIGPIVSREQLERVYAYLEIASKEGVTVLTGSEPLEEASLASGYFVRPTVFSGVENSMRIAQEEIFGPVLSGIAFDTFEDAMRLANNTIYGLGSGVWTRDVSQAHRASRAIRSGTVWVNSYGMLDPAVPFGGCKYSGYGRESGKQQMDAYLEDKSVYINL